MPHEGRSWSPEEMSRVIRKGLVPRAVPPVKGFDVAAGTNLADEGVGRSIWDYAQLADGRTALMALNVQGDGLPHAHYLAMTRSLFRELARTESQLDRLLARVNGGLSTAVVEGMEQYVEVGILVPTPERVEWAVAGRCLGGIIRRTGIFEEFTRHGPPLGMMDGFKYGLHQTELGVGDAVVVLSEASQGIFRGAADLVASLHGKPVKEVVSLVQKALRKAQPDRPLETSILFVRKH